MSALGNIIKKEIKELLTPATILPIVFVAIIFGTMGNTIGGITEQAQEMPTIGLINEDDGYLSNMTANMIHENAKVVFNSTSKTDKDMGIEAVEKEEGNALLIIPSNFSSRISNNKSGKIEIYWIMEGAGIMDVVTSDSVERLIGIISWNMSKTLIEQNTTINSTLALQPVSRIETTYFKEKELPGLSPGIIMGLFSQQSFLIPIVIMMIIIMSGGMVISSMALEKENKTLETLLTLPVRRTVSYTHLTLPTN